MDIVLGKALSFLSTIEGSSVTIAIVLEFAFRMIPSGKPLSVFYVVSSALKKSGEFLTKVGLFLDKVLPQKLK